MRCVCVSVSGGTNQRYIVVDIICSFCYNSTPGSTAEVVEVDTFPPNLQISFRVRSDQSG